LKVTENVKMDEYIRKIEKRNDELYNNQPLMIVQKTNEVSPWLEQEVILIYIIDCYYF